MSDGNTKTTRTPAEWAGAVNAIEFDAGGDIDARAPSTLTTTALGVIGRKLIKRQAKAKSLLMRLGNAGTTASTVTTTTVVMRKIVKGVATLTTLATAQILANAGTKVLGFGGVVDDLSSDLKRGDIVEIAVTEQVSNAIDLDVMAEIVQRFEPETA